MAKKLDFANQELRRETIFSATFKVILKDGISGLRINSVAKEAGISKTLVHYYFKDKDTLLVEFIRALFRKFLDYVERRYRASDPPQIKIEAFFGAGKDFIDKQQDLLVVLIEVWCYCIRDPRLKKEFAKLNKKTAEVMVKILDEGERQGVFNKVRKEALSAFYLAFIVGSGILSHLDKQFFDTGEQFGILSAKFSAFLKKNLTNGINDKFSSSESGSD